MPRGRGSNTGRPLVPVAGFAAAVSAVRAAARAAGPGVRGVVSFRIVDEGHDRVINVAADDQGRVVFLDGRVGGLAALPANPEVVRFVLTAGD